MDTDAVVVVLARHPARHGARPVRSGRIRQRAGSDDDWVIASVLVLAVSGAVGLVAVPLSAATAVLAPFVHTAESRHRYGGSVVALTARADPALLPPRAARSA